MPYLFVSTSGFLPVVSLGRNPAFESRKLSLPWATWRYYSSQELSWTPTGLAKCPFLCSPQSRWLLKPFGIWPSCVVGAASWVPTSLSNESRNSLYTEPSFFSLISSLSPMRPTDEAPTESSGTHSQETSGVQPSFFQIHHPGNSMLQVYERSSLFLISLQVLQRAGLRYRHFTLSTLARSSSLIILLLQLPGQCYQEIS